MNEIVAPARPLPVELLCQRCDPALLAFRTTDDLPDLAGFLGQDRAIDAVRFGIGIRRDGYNLFAFGPAGTGKQSLIRSALEAQAGAEPPPQDWCYVNNFRETHKPRAIGLPAGRGQPLRGDMEKLVTELRAAIAAAFEGEDYRSRRQAIEEQYKQRHEKTFGELQKKANERGVALIRTPTGLAFAPMHAGEVISPEIFRQWPEEHQAKIRATIAELEEEMQRTVQQVPQWEREQRERTRELNKDVTAFAVSLLMDEMRLRYADIVEVIGYFDEVQADVVDNADAFVAPEPTEAPDPEQALAVAMRRSMTGAALFRRYQVNLIVNHAGAKSAPVVHEDNPSFPNLVGRIEHMAQFGALITDFNLIKSGALHAANGGYLMLEARKALTQPYVWEELKRALKSHEIRVQGLPEMRGFASTVSLEPEPIPLELKIILIGDPKLYYMLASLDPEFPELFKVAVDFDDRIVRTDETNQLYARLVATLVRREKLAAFDVGAVARVLEHSARLAGDAERLTLHMRAIVDLLREADYWAGASGHAAVTADDVRRAIAEQQRRLGRIRERSLEEIRRGTILIATKDAVAGQVNGLSVLQIGELVFGRPSRITARVRMGRGELIDIEREVELGGPLHSKGVLILSGFLGERYARQNPLALSASLVFEQSYGGVDGDSASSAELYALLSALSGVPIRQSLAVTGSVNQLGEVQAIGGVNEKIEGFFDVCAARGLDGAHGVLIPDSNVKHLMLRDDVVAAVALGKFAIYPVKTIDQGIEILTGVPAGAPDRDGAYPDGTINHKVKAQLLAFAERARAFGGAGTHDAER